MRLDRMGRRRISAGWIKFFLLTELELEALRQIAVHPTTHHIPYRFQARLKDIGYAEEVFGGLVLTDDGLQRITIDRERSRSLFEADASR